MEPTLQHSSLEADRALARSVLYAAAATGLTRPTPGSLARLLSPGALDALEAAASCAAPDSGLAARARSLAAWTVHDVDAIERESVALFGHAVRGAVPPYETEYGDGSPFQQPAQLADIAGFFAAFGLRVDDQVHERVDHVSAECEFMQFLCQKEAHAREVADDEMLRDTQAAQRLFLREHLGSFAPGFGARVHRERSEGFFDALQSLLVAQIELDAERLGVRLGPPSIELRSAEPDATPMACGSDCGSASAGGACSNVSFPEAEK